VRRERGAVLGAPPRHQRLVVLQRAAAERHHRHQQVAGEQVPAGRSGVTDGPAGRREALEPVVDRLGE
jgi:hypothetical protein